MYSYILNSNLIAYFHCNAYDLEKNNINLLFYSNSFKYFYENNINDFFLMYICIIKLDNYPIFSWKMEKMRYSCYRHRKSDKYL